MPNKTAVLDWLAAKGSEMETMLAEVVAIDSGSDHPEGIEAVRQHFARFFTENGIEIADIDTPVGPCLSARTGPDSNRGHVLLMGHMDTVFPDDETRRRPWYIENRDGQRLGRGPGCADMKAGLVMNAFILAAFAANGGAPVPLRALYTRDEELGSPNGRAAIESEATGARAVFNAEPGRKSGNVVKARRGGTFFRAIVTGRSAHAGQNPHEGRSAIEEMARKILAWHALTSEEPDVTVSVGIVKGGQAVNMIAPFCEAKIDLRFAEAATGERLEAEIRRIAEACARDGLSGALERLGGFLPVVETASNQSLVELYLGVARELGHSTQAEFTRSCADSGFTANMGVPTVCGTGPVGGNAHSPEEYVELDTFVPRAQAVALSIMRLAEQR
jgi:glutamate carboxypeptidase